MTLLKINSHRRPFAHRTLRLVRGRLCALSRNNIFLMHYLLDFPRFSLLSLSLCCISCFSHFHPILGSYIRMLHPLVDTLTTPYRFFCQVIVVYTPFFFRCTYFGFVRVYYLISNIFLAGYIEYMICSCFQKLSVYSDAKIDGGTKTSPWNNRRAVRI
jgi:hypothetical protein